MAIAVGFGGGHLGLTLLGQRQGAQASVAIKNSEAAQSPNQQSKPEAPWPVIFGTYEPDALPPPPPPEPEPEVTVFSHNYTLKGLFASATNSWAIVSDPGGEYLLRTGDELPGGALVDKITENGVWLKTPQGRALIAFTE